MIRQLPCIYICSKKWPTIFSFLTTTLISHTHFSKQIDPSSSQLAFQCCSIETSEIGTWRDWNMFLQGSLYDVPCIIVYSRWKKKVWQVPTSAIHSFWFYQFCPHLLHTLDGIVKKLPSQWMISFEKKRGKNRVHFSHK